MRGRLTAAAMKSDTIANGWPHRPHVARQRRPAPSVSHSGAPASLRRRAIAAHQSAGLESVQTFGALKSMSRRKARRDERSA